MCINCNIYAPIKHNFCDLLGIERNKYSFPSSSTRIYENLLSAIRSKHLGYDLYIDKSCEKIFNWFVDNNLWEKLEDDIKEELKINNMPGPIDNSVINFVYCRYFTNTGENVESDFFENWRIPINILTDDVDFFKRNFKKIKFTQIKQIPRKVLQSWNSTENDFVERCKLYDIELLEKPVTDNEPTSDDHVNKYYKQK